MLRTIAKSTILAAGLSLLHAPAYASDTAQPQLDTDQLNAPAVSTDTTLETKKNEFPEFWTGFYGGINLGGNFASADVHSNQLGFINPDGTCNVKSTISSFFPGVQFGYLHHFNSNVVMGVEGDFTYNTQNRENITCPCPTYLPASDHFRVENRLQGSLRGRLGYALDGNLLPFVTAGVSFADMGIKYSNEGGDVYNKSATHVGWLVGAGLEWGFADNLSVRGEYYYKAYDNLNIAIPNIYGLTDANGAGHLNLHDNTVRVAFNYWF